MKTFKKTALWSVAGILVLFLAARAFMEITFSGWGFCANTIYQETHSPDKSHKAVVFERNCGATTGFSTQVSVLNPSEALPEGKGNTYIAAGHPQHTKLQLNWRKNDHLVITNSETNAIKSANQVGSIQISFE